MKPSPLNRYTELKRTGPPKRKTGLRRMSDKKKNRDAEVSPLRRQMKEDAGECMVCRKPLPPNQLDCDEIARGHARDKCLDEPLLILVSCRACHKKTQDLPIPKRIALRVQWTIERTCARYNELRGTADTHVTKDDVVQRLFFTRLKRPKSKSKQG